MNVRININSGLETINDMNNQHLYHFASSYNMKSLFKKQTKGQLLTRNEKDVLKEEAEKRRKKKQVNEKSRTQF